MGTRTQGWARPRTAIALLLAGALALAAAPGGGLLADGDQQRHGDLQFPRDEHQHGTGLDFWWGAADVVTEAGNHYTVGMAYTSFWGFGTSTHEVFAHQGPYDGQSLLTVNGTAEWGHPEGPGRFVVDMSNAVTDERLRLRTLDLAQGGREVNSWRRVRMDAPVYRFQLEEEAAKVHPEGSRIGMQVDLTAEMADPPLLAGGEGTWWYGIPETFDYESRSFQYVQAADQLSGTLRIEQPDGSILEEVVDPERSSMQVIHEYDATPEDIPGGLAVAETTQLHERYFQHYQMGMPWELIFLDLDNGAQLMVAVMAFHEAEKGVATDAMEAALDTDAPVYDVLTTLRLPSGESVPIDNLHVEHLSYRFLTGKAPTFFLYANGLWQQAWDFRLSHPGGTITAPDGTEVEVPAFDLGVDPMFDRDEPAVDERGNGQIQRVPFDVAGTWDGCPIGGTGWSELIINWYGEEADDPWFTGGQMPAAPDGCLASSPTPPRGTSGTIEPDEEEEGELQPHIEGCTTAFTPSQPRCEYTATSDAGVVAYAPEPGGWTITIHRPDRDDPIVLTSQGDFEWYGCTAIRAGDHVVVEAEPGAVAGVVNPGICW